ncbi:hypothetical protein [Metapseudomonas otitidis]|uniref:hypothetical protein n=1 Tax=Metapseudomonas otitidis TaxID=319939 RepID=UPI002446851C|nr:hypothetical protein [Pseudomonas otitidis]MDG9784665.1 hypothetical protein [Pseudomonas otitidis]
MKITPNEAAAITTEAIEFMAKKAGVPEAEIVAALQAGQESVVRYFGELLQLGCRKVLEMPQQAA